MNTEKIVAQLKEYANIFEVYQKTTFTGYREDKNGNTQEVEVDILDAGPNRLEHRYRCIAKSGDDKIATGNPESTIDMALLHVHWNNLD
ncbi:MAG: hypothetical protein KAS75_04400 [Planctomycetes bacterium]|nr:hypothetical protein [Planctomycetota bacterium]